MYKRGGTTPAAPGYVQNGPGAVRFERIIVPEPLDLEAARKLVANCGYVGSVPSMALAALDALEAARKLIEQNSCPKCGTINLQPQGCSHRQSCRPIHAELEAANKRIRGLKAAVSIGKLRELGWESRIADQKQRIEKLNNAHAELVACIVNMWEMSKADKNRIAGLETQLDKTAESQEKIEVARALTQL